VWARPDLTFGVRGCGGRAAAGAWMQRTAAARFFFATLVPLRLSPSGFDRGSRSSAFFRHRFRHGTTLAVFRASLFVSGTCFGFSACAARAACNRLQPDVSIIGSVNCLAGRLEDPRAMDATAPAFAPSRFGHHKRACALVSTTTFSSVPLAFKALLLLTRRDSAPRRPNVFLPSLSLMKLVYSFRV